MKKKSHQNKALTCEALAHDFGPGSKVTRHAVRALYDALLTSGPPVSQSFPNWRSLFARSTDYRKWRSRLENQPSFGRLLEKADSGEDYSADKLFFTVHTYYALVVKIVAAMAASAFCLEEDLGEHNDLENEYGPRRFFAGLESGHVFDRAGIAGFYDDRLFSWYLNVWDENLEAALGPVAKRLFDYGPLIVEADGASSKDLLRNLYQKLVPSKVRRDLGEYYTPDWLAERVIERTFRDEDKYGPGKRVLDPACGSGPFLVALIKMIRQNASSSPGPAELLAAILDNVAGIDLNPLAALSARANYLLALGDLLRHKEGGIKLPVFNADSILADHEDAALREKFDYIVGNPPWVNWENLPPEYREKTRSMWVDYGLFPQQGMDTILGAGKKDLCMLMTYVCADRYLKDGGRLGFVIARSVFKNSGAARGFRSFRLPCGAPFGPMEAEDLSALKAFSGVSAGASSLVVEKGREVKYPVPYLVHGQSRKESVPTGDIDGVGEKEGLVFNVEELEAGPKELDPCGPWLTGGPVQRLTFSRLAGRSSYTAREGANTGGANSVYWVEMVAELEEGVLVKNFIGRSKKPAEQVEAMIEPGLLFPLIRSGDLAKWSARSRLYIILSQDTAKRKGIAPPLMEKDYPLTLSYLSRFEDHLQSRAAYKRYFKSADPFWSMFNIGGYTLGKWKVVWKRMGLYMQAAVTGPHNNKPVVPQETLCFVSTDSETEAHYLCALLNSRPFDTALGCLAQRGSKSFASPYILKDLLLPDFSPGDKRHLELADLSRKAHEAAAGNDTAEIEKIQARADLESSSLWGCRLKT